MRSAVTPHSDNSASSVCTEDVSEDRKNHDVPQSSCGLEPTGVGHSGEEQESASSVKEPEATSPADAKDRSEGSKFVI